MVRGANFVTRITNQSSVRERLVANARMATLDLATMRTPMAIQKSGSAKPMALPMGVPVLPLMWSWMQEAIADLAGFVAIRLIYMAPRQGRRRMELLRHTTHTLKVLLMGCQLLLLLTPAMLHPLDTLVMVGHRQLCIPEGDPVGSR